MNIDKNNFDVHTKLPSYIGAPYKNIKHVDKWM